MNDVFRCASPIAGNSVRRGLPRRAGPQTRARRAALPLALRFSPAYASTSGRSRLRRLPQLDRRLTRPNELVAIDVPGWRRAGDREQVHRALLSSVAVRSRYVRGDHRRCWAVTACVGEQPGGLDSEPNNIVSHTAHRVRQRFHRSGERARATSWRARASFLSTRGGRRLSGSGSWQPNSGDVARRSRHGRRFGIREFDCASEGEKTASDPSSCRTAPVARSTLPCRDTRIFPRCTTRAAWRDASGVEERSPTAAELHEVKDPCFATVDGGSIALQRAGVTRERWWLPDAPVPARGLRLCAQTPGAALHWLAVADAAHSRNLQ